MKNKKLMAAIIGGVCLVLLGYYVYSFRFSARDVTIDETREYPVTRVIDGDTFKADIDGRDITVRLLGINTPETVDPRKAVECYGPEASEETKSLLTGQSVRLKLNPHREVKDKYGRYLLYVYRDDGLFVNEYLVQQGFAREYTYGKAYSFQAEFKAVEGSAKSDKKGLWGACGLLGVQG